MSFSYLLHWGAIYHWLKEREEICWELTYHLSWDQKNRRGQKVMQEKESCFLLLFCCLSMQEGEGFEVFQEVATILFSRQETFNCGV